MVHRLLVPLDGTPFAEGALPYAEALAERTGATIQLVRASLVRNPPPDNTEEARIVAAERAYLAGVARRLGGATAATLQHADPDTAIVEQARQWGADLIIMATHERGMLERVALGSVMGGVLAATPAPVFLIHPEEAPPLAGPHHLLLPLDGSNVAEAALPIATALAAALDAPITLVAALTGDGAWGAAGAPSNEAANRRVGTYLGEMADRLAGSGLRVASESRVGDAPAVIAGVAQEVGATLIVMATHGRTGLRRLVLGSVADAVLHSTALPLVLVRPASDEREP